MTARHETPDVAELRRLAEAANADAVQGATYERDWPLSSRAVGHFLRALNPDAVLALLDDADALRAELAHMTEARDAARAEVERLTAAVRRVRELHRESRGSMSALYPNPICECGKDYPCPTIRAQPLPAGAAMTDPTEPTVRTVGDLTARHQLTRPRIRVDGRVGTLKLIKPSDAHPGTLTLIWGDWWEDVSPEEPCEVLPEGETHE